MATISITCFTDPGCPWAYSAEPSFQVLRWRYRGQLDWRLVLIGLTERAAEYEARGYTPLSMARGYQRYRRYGMPFATEPRPRVVATGRACRTVVAARIDRPGLEWSVLRALQLAWFTTPLVLDEDAAILAALESVPGLDAEALVARLGDADVEDAYRRDRAEAREAEGTPASLQGKTARTDGPERYTAPSLTFERDGRRLVAGGFQPVEAYDVLVANLAPDLGREQPPDGPLPLLEHFPGGLTTQEVATLLARGNDPPDRLTAEAALIELAAAGHARRRAVGDDALWLLLLSG
jgi:predicted DsbA family dithiol-disulfide isomerase